MASKIHYACNDWRNGNHLGFSESIEIEMPGGQVALAGGRVRTTVKGDVLHISRIKVPILGYRSWAGNWCWDMVYVSWVEALRAFNYLMKNKDWHCEEGPAVLYDAFNERRALSGKDLRDAQRHAAD